MLPRALAEVVALDRQQLRAGLQFKPRIGAAHFESQRETADRLRAAGVDAVTHQPNDPDMQLEEADLLRRIGYLTGFFAAVVVMHLVMPLILNVTPVASTRFIGGLLLQGLAGAVGGYVFFLLGRSSAAQQV